MNDFWAGCRSSAGAGVLGLAILLVGGCRSGGGTLTVNPNTRADEAAIRRLDADWVKAGATKNPDEWMAFYAPDAVVLPPNEKVAKTKEAIRASVAGLLGLPGLVLTWTPSKVEVAASGELAYLYGAYEFTAKDTHGKPINDYGKNVEIWKKQPDGGWKCIVDTWNSDLPAAP